MEKLKQIVESGELRQVLEHRFSNVVVDAVIEKVSERKSRKCNHAAKLQAAEEMRKVIKAIVTFQTSEWLSVRTRLEAALQLWEQAGKGEG